jgi:hypothetical protein
VSTTNLSVLIVKLPAISTSPLNALTTNLSVLIFKLPVADKEPSFPNVKLGASAVPPTLILPPVVIVPGVLIAPVELVTINLLVPPILKSPDAVIDPAVVNAPVSEMVNAVPLIFKDVAFKEVDAVILALELMEPLALMEPLVLISPELLIVNLLTPLIEFTFKPVADVRREDLIGRVVTIPSVLLFTVTFLLR